MPDLSLGYGPAKINVPLPSWAKIKRWLLGKELQEQVYVLLQSASLRIDREGEGVAEFTVWVANLSPKAITLDRVVLHLWTWLSRVLPRWNFQATGRSALEISPFAWEVLSDIIERKYGIKVNQQSSKVV